MATPLGSLTGRCRGFESLSAHWKSRGQSRFWFCIVERYNRQAAYRSEISALTSVSVIEASCIGPNRRGSWSHVDEERNPRVLGRFVENGEGRDVAALAVQRQGDEARESAHL